MAASAAVSRANIWAFWNFGSAMVIIIRMIAITISNSMRENPRRLLKLNIASPPSLLYDGLTGRGVEGNIIRG